MSEQIQVPTELHGLWRPVLFEYQGRLQPAPQEGALLQVVDGEFTVKSADYVWASGLVRVDAASRPRRIDFLQAVGPGLWSVQAGIYEVAGDELRLRLADGEVPPEQFDGEQGLAVYHRDSRESRR
jgi:uncharacterized protein (TIGR03067 family)